MCYANFFSLTMIQTLTKISLGEKMACLGLQTTLHHRGKSGQKIDQELVAEIVEELWLALRLILS